MRIGCIIPTRNAGNSLGGLLMALQRQTVSPICVYVVDSASTDDTVSLAKKHGAIVQSIFPDDFRHGATRQEAAQHLLAHWQVDALLFCTQDIELIDQEALASLQALLRSRKDIGVVYGRQLAATDADPLAVHARMFNYTGQNRIASYQDIESLGIKAAFCSNSFALYRTKAFFETGGFARTVILGEDMELAARMLKKGWSVGYAAGARVYHSHSYSVLQYFHRAFDTGVFHAQCPWLLRELGAPQGEGLRFVLSEMAFLWTQRAYAWLPRSCVVNVGKFLGYHLGRWHRWLPRCWVIRCTGHEFFWK